MIIRVFNARIAHFGAVCLSQSAHQALQPSGPVLTWLSTSYSNVTVAHLSAESVFSLLSCCSGGSSRPPGTFWGEPAKKPLEPRLYNWWILRMNHMNVLRHTHSVILSIYCCHVLNILRYWLTRAHSIVTSTCPQRRRMGRNPLKKLFNRLKCLFYRSMGSNGHKMHLVC